MPLTYHDWTHPVPSSLVYISLRKVDDVPITVEGTTVQYIYINHPNHSWENVYDCGCTKNTLTALYTTDQQHVLISSTYLPRNNDRRQGRRCTIVDDVPSWMMYQPDQSLRIGGTYFSWNKHSRKGNGVTHVRYYDPAYIYRFCTGVHSRNAQSASEQI